MEEIDIIELLKRVKEGKAPKEIKVNGVVYERNTDEIFRNNVDLMYQHYKGVDEPIDWWIDDNGVTLDTKIKILDKPIIEEMDMINRPWINHAELIPEKINEIIRCINNKENKDE